MSSGTLTLSLFLCNFVLYIILGEKRKRRENFIVESIKREFWFHTYPRLLHMYLFKLNGRGKGCWLSLVANYLSISLFSCTPLPIHNKICATYI